MPGIFILLICAVICSGSFKEFEAEFTSINSPAKFDIPTPKIERVRPVTF
jgi:hypothetical protein